MDNAIDLHNLRNLKISTNNAEKFIVNYFLVNLSKKYSFFLMLNKKCIHI